MKDYYNILGLSEKCDKNEIKKAYHKTALKYHPDKNKDTENLFKDAVEAYEVLYDDSKRRKYDLSRKLKQDYKFVLPPEILNFSKYFFSEENINKFSGFASIINNGLSNLSNNSKFDDLFTMLLDRIRNNNLADLYKEYNDFRKFYKVNSTHIPRKKENKPKNDLVNKSDIGKRPDIGKKPDIINKLKIPKEIPKLTNIVEETQDIIVNIKVSLENIYNNIIKVVDLEVNEKCSLCNGLGLLEKEEDIKQQYRNSRNKKKKGKGKKSLRKNDSYLEKTICSKCSGTMFNKKTRKFTINTNVDKICYHNCYYINNEKGYCDMIFNIKQKESFIKRKDRYDLAIDYNISLYEMYFGGHFYLDYLDGKTYKMVWEGFGNNHCENSKKIENMGLTIQNVEDLDIRGDLYINFNLVLPDYDKMLKYSNIEILKEIFDNKSIENNIGSSNSHVSNKVKEYNVINIE